VRVVPRRHRDTPDLRTLAHVAGAPGLAEALVLVVEVADLADRSRRSERHAAHLARREPDGGEVALLGEQLGRRAGGPDDLATLARDELDVVDGGAAAGCRPAGSALPTRASGRRTETTMSPTLRPFGISM
jgi:hypothetical protein